MSDDEVEYTIKALSKEQLPNPDAGLELATDTLYVITCLWDEHPLPKEIAKIMGQQWLDERLLHWVKQWIPYEIKQLSQRDHAIESTIGYIFDALKKFPEEVRQLVNLTELAHLRREALARAGTTAYKYLQTGQRQMARPWRMTLSDALLAGVPRERLGNPPRELCQAVLDKTLHRKDQDLPYRDALKEVARNHLATVREINATLNPLLA